MRVTGMLVVAALAAACSEPVDVAWKRKLPAASVSTPLVTEQFIAVGHELGLSVIEPNGAMRCTFSTQRDVISAPETDGKLIFFGSTNYIAYAIDPQCKEVWKFPTADRIKSDPLVAGGVVFVSSYDGHLYAMRATDGQRLWMFPGASEAHSEVEAPAKAKRIGKRKPNEPAPVDEAMEVGDFSYSSPVFDSGVIYLGNLDHHLYAIDAASGALRWRFKTDGPVTSTPLVSGGAIYFGSNDGNLYAVDLASQAVRFKVSTLDWVNSSPRLADGVIYVGSNDRHVYAIAADNGAVKWSTEIKGPAIAIPAVYKNLVIAAGASGDGSVYALQREGGAVFWTYATGAKIESDPVVVGDRVYVSSADATLYAFDIKQTVAQ